MLSLEIFFFVKFFLRLNDYNIFFTITSKFKCSHGNHVIGAIVTVACDYTKCLLLEIESNFIYIRLEEFSSSTRPGISFDCIYTTHCSVSLLSECNSELLCQSWI